MRRLLAICAVLGCGDRAPREVCERSRPDTAPPAVDTDSGGTLATGDTAAPPGAAAVIDVGPPIVCTDPSLRASARFVHKQTQYPGELANAQTWGGGAVIEDFDGDGDLDMLINGGDTLQLWENQGDNLFEDRGFGAFFGIELQRVVGGSAVDFDADGDIDVLLTQWGAPTKLLRNDGIGQFTDVSDVAGFTRAERSQSSSWADYDGDGDLDLFVGSYGDWAVIDVNEPIADCSDHIADASELYRNNGDGTFTDVSALLPRELTDTAPGTGSYVFASAWYDLDADGFPELFTSHDDGRCVGSVLVDNDGTAAPFSVDVASEFHPESHDMGLAVGDLNDDELPDFLMTSFKIFPAVVSFQVPGVGLNDLVYPNTPDFQASLAEDQVFGWGTELGDLDNDADLDLVALFGFWSTYDGAGDPRRQDDGLWLWNGDAFVDVAALPHWDVADHEAGRGVVLADLNGDGWLDIVKRHLGKPSPLYLSNCGQEGWLRIRLRAPGPNTRAVGAKIRVIVAGQRQVRWIQSGSSGMYTGQPLEAHFGLGMVDRVDRIEVVWPDGELSTFEDVETRRLLTITRQVGGGP